eukprot:363267-Chlamydomonas_euryale.AAC.9
MMSWGCTFSPHLVASVQIRDEIGAKRRAQAFRLPPTSPCACTPRDPAHLQLQPELVPHAVRDPFSQFVDDLLWADVPAPSQVLGLGGLRRCRPGVACACRDPMPAYRSSTW